MERFLFDPDVPGSEPGGEPAPEPTAPVIPDGHRIVSDADWTQLSSQAQQGVGAQKAFERFKGAGFDSFDSITDEQIQLLSKVAQSREYGADVLNRELFGENGIQDQRMNEPMQGLSQAQIDELVNERVESMLDKRLGEFSTKQSAQREYDQLLNAEKSGLAGLREELGMPGEIGEDDWTNQLLDLALQGATLKHGQLYPDNHPLAGQAMPLNGEAIEAARNVLINARELFGAKGQLDMARKVTQSKSAPSSGPSSVDTRPDDENRPLTKEEDEAALVEFFANRQKSRGGSPVSQA